MNRGAAPQANSSLTFPRWWLRVEMLRAGKQRKERGRTSANVSGGVRGGGVVISAAGEAPLILT